MQNEKVKSKNGFLDLAKHGLNKTWDLRPKIGLQIGRTVERERREEEKREEEEEERRDQTKVWKLNLSMESNLEYGFLLWNSKVCMNFHAIGWLLVVPKLRVY